MIRLGIICLSLTCFLLGGCRIAAPPARKHMGRPTPGGTRQGLASWYGGKFHGRKTASGERFDKHAMTAAHRSLPFGTRVKVTNLENGRSVIVRINDRGPFAKKRIIDVSRAAARKLGMLQAGLVRVKIRVLSRKR